MKEEGLKAPEVKERARNPVAKKAGLKVKGLHQTFQGLRWNQSASTKHETFPLRLNQPVYQGLPAG